MKRTLAQRVTPLEKIVAKLAGAAGNPLLTKQDWQCMAGRLRDTEVGREADRLGREFREEQNQK